MQITQLAGGSSKFLEISGLDPEITIRKIAVLPIKLYPLLTAVFISRKSMSKPE